MAVNKLLVAFDESEGADRALAMAASLAAVNPEAHVDVVYVVPIRCSTKRRWRTSRTFST